MGGPCEGVGMGMGWYGPLIDLSAASSYVGDFVQLLVFIHRFTHRRLQYKSGRLLRRTDIDVGDETRPFFCISIFNDHLASAVTAGDILFFRNVKVIRYGSMVEARSVEYTSILRLIHPYATILSRGVDDLVSSCQLVVGTAKDKLRKVINWVHHSTSNTTLALSNMTTSASNVNALVSPNWKLHQHQKATQCFLLSQLLHLSTPCKALFYGSVAQVLCHHPDSHKQKLLLSIDSLSSSTKTDMIVQHMICIGCLFCGSPLPSPSTTPLCCPNNYNRPHTVGFIYSPFLLYIWDNSEYVPLLVTNKAAEVLFGNITAEKVYQSYKGHMDYPNLKNSCKAQVNAQDDRTVEKKGTALSSSVGSELRVTNHDVKSLNFYLMWLIVLRMLLLKGKNSSLKFEALVNPCLALEDGRFQMISVSMPYSDSPKFSETN
ncbi:Pyridine nucleotide-disulfide oxidoreductase domain-containing protein 1 [Bienertia sinuspersici]